MKNRSGDEYGGQDGQGPMGAGPMGASPTRISSPELRFEAWRALTWTVVVGLVVLAIYISQSLLVIFGAMVFAALVDGGARLLGRWLSIGRGWRIAIVLLGATAFLVWLAFFAGSQISQQAAAFPSIVETQASRIFAWMREQGFEISMDTVQSMATQAASGFGTVTSALTGLLGGLTTLLLIVIIGIYVVIEPRLYERGVAWMLPSARRDQFYNTASRMGYTMRRLLFGRLVGMVFEGIFTYIMLLGYGLVTGDQIPMAALLAILTGLLAFIPNIGAIISGVLMVLVGFSGGAQMGIYTIVVYLAVQNIDGYLVIPLIARKTVDLAPALVLGMQLIMGILFGILGLFLADPLLAMIKVMLEERAKAKDEEDANEIDRQARDAGDTHRLEGDPA
ncbi:AI-2E family transporter [Aurantiacibacter poecillastricola]|uniref:AI-2E family transporter n=1 Tax=Aurantiacibacter poecillastricola TaxID=3064385 RepID=UPI00273E6133|nr:AI-2E family transporter [Aurantiacibacter sp. 219JJ12-13]MDP5261468.1 AI-2E family transporter [Aurantiacibacter sp. 219JJ12-13]